MNERIKQLALKAGGGLSCIAEPLEHPWKFSERELEKFAELILRECVEICDNTTGTSYLNGWYAGKQIRKHFGVEE